MYLGRHINAQLCQYSTISDWGRARATAAGQLVSSKTAPLTLPLVAGGIGLCVRRVVNHILCRSGRSQAGLHCVAGANGRIQPQAKEFDGCHLCRHVDAA